MVAIVSSAPFVLSKLEEFRREGKYSDVNIVVQDRTFKCHRLILVAVSSYFDTMFRGNFKESYVDEFQLHDVDSEVFEEILQNVYGGALNITENNAFDLLRVSEFLSIQMVRDPCIEFILKKKFILDNVIEIFIWARRMNVLPLIEPLLERISFDFIYLSENTAFLEMSFEDLHAVLAGRFITQSLFFKTDDLLVDALVRWLHYSYTERKKYFEILDAMIPSAKVSIEYCNFLSRKYGISLPISEEQNASKIEPFFKRYITHSDDYSPNDISLLSASFADHQISTNHSSIHVYLQGKIFSMNKYKPYGFISHVNGSELFNSVTNRESRPCLISSSESDYVYCIQANKIRSTPSFRAYSSIELSESNSRNLCPPPVFFNPKVALDETNKRIYYFECLSGVNQKNPNYKAFTNKELRVGVFYYNCERDEWFTVPQVTLEEEIRVAGQPIVDGNLVYFILSRGDVRAYDIRSSQLLTLPTLINRRRFSTSCCVLNGKIFVRSDGGLIVFDPINQRWETLISPFNDYCAFRTSCIVPYDNRMWCFDEKRLQVREEVPFYDELSIEVYNPNTREWHVSYDSLIGFNIFAKYGFKSGPATNSLLNVIVSKCKI